MHLGVTSIAFEALSVDEILSKMKQNQLTAVEWSEQHVASGEIAEANRIRLLSEEIHVKTVSYRASFCPLSQTDDEFSAILKTAKALGTDTVTLSAAPRLTEGEDPDTLLAFAQAAGRLADMANLENIRLCFSCAGGTLLDTYVHITHFMEIVDKKNVFINWQPNRTSSLIYNIYELKMLIPFIHLVYVLYAEASEECTHIIEGKDEWQQYLKVLKNSECNALLFKSCSKESFSAECTLMRDWIESAAG